MARSVSAAVLGALLVCMATLVLADAGKPGERYTRVPAGADGIGKRYMGRDIAGVMGWQGAAWLEREEREREAHRSAGGSTQLKPGMVVADIGAGTGYLARRMAPDVTPGGKVVAVDVQPEMVALLQGAVGQTGLTQIQPLLGAEDDVRLPASSVDLAIMVDVYHELAFPYEMLASIVRALKPGGRSCSSVSNRRPAGADGALHKMSEARSNAKPPCTLVWERTVNLPWQRLVVFAAQRTRRSNVRAADCQRLVHRAGVGPIQLAARKQVFAEGVQQRMQFMPCQTQLFMHGQAVEPLDLGFADVAIGDHRQCDDAGSRLRAVYGVAAHDGSSLVLSVTVQSKMSLSQDFLRLLCGRRPCS
jgi:SAM-dependent methyltransferase